METSFRKSVQICRPKRKRLIRKVERVDLSRQKISAGEANSSSSENGCCESPEAPSAKRQRAFLSDCMQIVDGTSDRSPSRPTSSAAYSKPLLPRATGPDRVIDGVDEVATGLRQVIVNMGCWTLHCGALQYAQRTTCYAECVSSGRQEYDACIRIRTRVEGEILYCSPSRKVRIELVQQLISRSTVVSLKPRGVYGILVGQVARFFRWSVQRRKADIFSIGRFDVAASTNDHFPFRCPRTME